MAFLEDNSFLNFNQQTEINQQPLTHDIKEEIIDFNIFELLRSEDPEIASLLEHINPETIGTYLPQISINSANRILDNPPIDLSSIQFSNQTTGSIIKLDDIDPSSTDMHDLLVLGNSAANNLTKQNVVKKILPPSPPLTPPTAAPARVSMRLMKKRETNAEFTTNRISNNDNKNKKASKRCLKRKRSIDEDEFEENHSMSTDNNLLSNENSIDFDSIYSAPIQEQDETNEHDFLGFESSNECDFKEYVRRSRGLTETDSPSSRNKRSDSTELNPIKKECNKEAATRYRLKKLSEKEQLFETRIHLEKENDQVKKNIELVQTEINYLKNLLVQMILTKGIIDNTTNSTTQFKNLF